MDFHSPEIANLQAHGLIVWLIVGAVAGWLAGLLVKGGGFGLVGDIIVGLIGAVVGGWLAMTFHVTVGTGIVSAIVVATAGAVLLTFIIRTVRSI